MRSGANTPDHAGGSPMLITPSNNHSATGASCGENEPLVPLAHLPPDTPESSPIEPVWSQSKYLTIAEQHYLQRAFIRSTGLLIQFGPPSRIALSLAVPRTVVRLDTEKCPLENSAIA